MARRFATCLVVGLIGCFAAGVGSAGAATEIGSDCTPDFTSLDSMVVQVKRSTPPVAVQTASPGVVTSWRVKTSASAKGPAVLKILKQVGAEFEVVAESGAGTLLPSTLNVFPTRISVPAGISFGLAADDPQGCAVVGGDFGDELWEFETAPSVGSKAKATGAKAPAFVPLKVVIEPDADGDGYGDETQDKCPQSAATQGACPVAPSGGGAGTGGATVKLKGKPQLEGNVVAVKLTTSAPTALTVTGSIRGKQAAAPATKTVSPGETGRVYLTLKKGVKRRLANLPRKRKLTMVIEVKAAGSPTVSAERIARAQEAAPKQNLKTPP